MDYAIFLLDGDGAVVTGSRGAEHILRYTEAEMIGETLHRLFADEDRNGHDGDLEVARDGGRSESDRYHFRKDGSRFYGNSVTTALRDEETLVGYVTILRDVSARKAAHDALESAYRRERYVTEVLQSPLLTTTAQSDLGGLMVSSHYESLLDEAAVGGDFFDVFPLADGQVALAVGDASGKGVKAALRAMQVKELLRAAFSLVAGGTPGGVVSELNRYLSGSDRKHDLDSGFVTLALAVFDPAARSGVFVCAGCEPLLVVRADGTTQILEASGTPLSVYPDAVYEAHPFSLVAGDTLLLLTDGITEARAGKQFLEYEGIVALATRAAGEPTLAAMGTAIVEGARRFAGGQFRDDVCLLLARLGQVA